MADNSDSDSDCWYNKDEDEILASVKVKATTTVENTTEHITEIHGKSKADEYIKKYDVTSSQLQSKKPKILIGELKKIRNSSPLDAFLYTFTCDPVFFEGALVANDGHDKVFLYLRILKMISDLELPGFHRDLLQYFIQDAILMDHLRYLASKLFSKRYKAIWKESESVRYFIGDTQSLFMKAHQLKLVTESARATIEHICMAHRESDFSSALENPECIEMVQHLSDILNNVGQQQQDRERQEIYPSLDELLANGDDPCVELFLRDVFPDEDDAVVADASEMPQNRENFSHIDQYIAHQRDQLREDFMASLRFLVSLLRREKSFEAAKTILQHSLYADHVCIVLNEQFVTANRHEMIFVDMLGSGRATSSKIPKHLNAMLRRLKNGALLCFTTSWEFEDLVLAKVTFTAADVLSDGYIGVEVVRQHNIGNIYNKPLICFETPTFFEPYHNVHNYLATCNAHDFPLKEYFINDKMSARKPAYLNGKTAEPKSVGTALNEYQRDALAAALNHEFYLIQGPPGTGKTHLSVELVNTLIRNATPAQPIVLVTYTNESLDKFLMKLAAHTDSIARFGSRTRRPEIMKFNVHDYELSTPGNAHLKRLYYIVKLEFKQKFGHLQQLLREFDSTDLGYHGVLLAQRQVQAVCEKLNCTRIMFQYYAIRDKSIVALTTTCAAKTNFLFRLLQSAIVIFEEAAEILESHVLACLTPFTQHIIMIGDHMQLRPYSTLTPYLGGAISAPKIAVSLFERLFLQNLKHSVLKIQYRMRPCIADLVCGTFYKELHNAPIVETYPSVRNMSKNLFFLSHEFSESKSTDGTSFYNEHELQRIMQLASHLVIEAEYDSSDIVILSPYASQVDCFAKEISKSKNTKLHGIQAATVDSFQGLEANIVLVSLVRSTQLGFLSQSNRICVLLSRAKHGMYIVGNLKVISRNSKWRMIKTKLKSQDAIHTEFPYDPPKLFLK